MAANRPCLYPGCSGTKAVRGFCEAHASRRRASDFGQRNIQPEPYWYGSTWKKIRLMHLSREPMCRTCGDTATEVDHIIPLSKGGTNDESNLQSLCIRCHSRKTYNENNGTQKPVTIVHGPAGSGKTQYVREHAKRGDLIYDWDAIYSAISGRLWYDQPTELKHVMFAIRDAIIREVAMHPLKAWIISATDSEDALQALAVKLNARIVRMNTPLGECARRIAADPRRRNTRLAFKASKEHDKEYIVEPANNECQNVS